MSLHCNVHVIRRVHKRSRRCLCCRMRRLIKRSKTVALQAGVEDKICEGEPCPQRVRYTDFVFAASAQTQASQQGEREAFGRAANVP